MKPLFIPPSIVDSMSTTLAELNEAPSPLGIIVIIAADGYSPTVCSNFPPEAVYVIYEWLLEQRDDCTIEDHTEPN